MQLPCRIPVERIRPLARLLCRGEVVALTLQRRGQLRVEGPAGITAEAEILPRTTVFNRLVVLRYRVAGSKTETLVLPPAATGEDAHRRLRVWLRSFFATAG